MKPRPPISATLLFRPRRASWLYREAFHPDEPFLRVRIDWWRRATLTDLGALFDPEPERDEWIIIDPNEWN